MNLLTRVLEWLDVRPGEVRNVTLSFFGAFLVIAFATLARSLREAFYLTEFPVETLPYITAAVAVLSVPTVGYFARTLAHQNPRRVLAALLVLLSAGLAVFALLALVPGMAAYTKVATVAFYLWTALGTLLATSGFWVLTAEYYAVRGAKRLFGLIGAGGTAGAMVMGNLLIWLTQVIDTEWLAAGLVGLLLLFLATQLMLPKLDVPHVAEAESGSQMRESVKTIQSSPHLRAIALIVFAVAVATTLLDYQFKEAARAIIQSPEGLTSFFGAFYGWTGAAALVIQLLVAARFLAGAGIAWTLAILPLTLMLGSVGMLIAPSLALVTMVRGGDNSLRKSLYRSGLEVTYVPVPSLQRRKTKTFIDTVVDSVGEGLGAGIIFLWVTLPGLPSRYLSAFIILISAWMLLLSRRMGRQYFSTVTDELRDSGSTTAKAGLEGRDLLSGTFTRLDIKSLLVEEGVADEVGDEQMEEPAEATVDSIAQRLASRDLRIVARTLEDTVEWDENHIPDITRMLARDQLFDRVVLALLTAGDVAVPSLIQFLRDESTDFVIRRRIPRVLARMGGPEADAALLEALSANRFEVRDRSAIALVRRRRRDLPVSELESESAVWAAIRAEVGRDRPVWELQKLLDDTESGEDDLVSQRIGARGELSLEHTFRLLTLVLEPKVVQAAFHGVMTDDENLKSFSLEYLEQVLPTDIRSNLWPFIGDVSEYKRDKSLRSLDDVVSDLMETGATLFADAEHREALKRMLEDQED